MSFKKDRKFFLSNKRWLSQSKKIGLQSLYITEFTVAIKVIDGTIISSFFFGFSSLIANCSAEVQLIVPKLYFPVVNFSIFFSNFLTIFPFDATHLSFKHFFKKTSSSPKKEGSDNLIIFNLSS